MWSYYGSKSKIIQYYPQPKYNTIVEPFAGSAQYSLKYWENEIILIDKYDKICNLWKWLQNCSVKDILETRRLAYGESVNDFEWDCEERKYLVGFLISASAAIPKNKATKWKTILRPNAQNYKLQFIAKNLYKIKHWKIICGEYDKNSPEIKATWFIDPPYVIAGKHYKFGSKYINYEKLAIWCKNLKGQIIVCENENQKWLDFKPLISFRGIRRQSNEAVCIIEN